MEENGTQALNHSGDETATTETPTVAEQTTDEGFLAGFGESEIADEQTETTSDSKEEPEDVNNNNNQEEKYTRPDKHTRASERIQRLIAENRAKDEELAEYRAWKAKQQEPLLQRDEDGNVSAEDFAEYNRQVIAQEIEKVQAEQQARIAEAERQRDLESSIHSIQDGISERIAQFDFLNKNSNNYNPNLEKSISQGALDYVAQLQAMGVGDYATMAEATLEYIDRQIEIVRFADEQAKINASQSLTRMKNGGALGSNNSGEVSESDDFLSGFSM